MGHARIRRWAALGALLAVAASSGGPLTVPAEELRSRLGLREVVWRGSPGPLAVVDTRLA